jgi:hypothetical protein
LETIEFHRAMLDDKPTRNLDGKFTLFVLDLMDGSVTVVEIARRTAARFPLQFSRFEQAFEQVQEVFELYGRRAGESFENNRELQTEVLA